jgi:hypothetical protein
MMRLPLVLSFLVSVSAYLHTANLKLTPNLNKIRAADSKPVCRSHRQSIVMAGGRVPFIAGNWKMNPETVDQVLLLFFDCQAKQ